MSHHIYGCVYSVYSVYCVYLEKISQQLVYHNNEVGKNLPRDLIHISEWMCRVYTGLPPPCQDVSSPLAGGQARVV